MSTNQLELERMQILIPKKQKARMKRLANQSNCSVSEIYRRAADAYSISEDDNEINHPKLEALVEALEVSNKRSVAAIDRAVREVAATLDFYESRAETREARSQNKVGAA